MMNKKTVFVIGAGSGHDIDMPMGVELARMIARSTKMERAGHSTPQSADPGYGLGLRMVATRAAANQWPNHYLQLAKAANQISGGIQLANSIDDYVDIHNHDADIVTCAKLAIAHHIIKSEAACKFSKTDNRDKSLNFQHLASTWYVKLFKTISRGVLIADIDRLFNHTIFINFNYDRCLEHFLVNAVQKLYSVPVNVARDAVSIAKIYHPYGQVGGYPGMASGMPEMPFGGGENIEHILPDIIKYIQTYTEKVQDYTIVDAMQGAVADAQQIVFLGFGFHQQNMELICPPPAENVVKTVFATALKMSNANAKVVRSQLRRFTGVEGDNRAADDLINLETSCGCDQLIEDFSLELQI